MHKALADGAGLRVLVIAQHPAPGHQTLRVQPGKPVSVFDAFISVRVRGVSWGNR